MYNTVLQQTQSTSADMCVCVGASEHAVAQREHTCRTVPHHVILHALQTLITYMSGVTLQYLQDIHADGTPRYIRCMHTYLRYNMHYLASLCIPYIPCKTHRRPSKPYTTHTSPYIPYRNHTDHPKHACHQPHTCHTYYVHAYLAGHLPTADRPAQLHGYIHMYVYVPAYILTYTCTGP